MSIQTLKELQDQFVAKHDAIPRFCADGTDLGGCAVLNIKGGPDHPESDESRDFWRWYRALAEAAEEIAHRERAHAEDVETLRGLLDAKDRLLEAKDRELEALKAALACFTP